MQSHATISQSGEVDFPAWVKVLAWIIGILIPIAVLAGVWVGSTIFDMSVRMARMEGQLTTANEDRYRASQADAAHQLLETNIQTNTDDIIELQELHGRASFRRNRSDD